MHGPLRLVTGGALLACSACSPTPSHDTSVFALASAEPTAGEVWVERGGIALSTNHGTFGYHVALAGELALVSDDRVIHAFERDQDTWQEIEPIASPGVNDGPLAIAATAGTVAVTFLEYPGDQEVIWLAERDGQSWSTAKVVEGVAMGYRRLWPLGLSESLLAVFAGKADGSSEVIAFERGPAGLSQPMLVYAADEDDDELTIAVAGDTVLVALPYRTAANGSEGVVRVFARDGDAWQLAETLSAPEPDAAGFGYALAATPERVIAGSTTGQAYVFASDAGTWGKASRIDPPGTVVERARSVAVSDSLALVGLPDVQTGAVPYSGFAYMAFQTETGWSSSVPLSPDQALQNAQFGFAVALSETQALVSAPGELRPRSQGRVLAYGACTSDAQCPTGRYCTSQGTCKDQKPLGQTCDLGLDCLEPGCAVCRSSFCVDGYCCDSGCDGQCQACDEALLEGECHAVSGAPRGARRACDGDDSECRGSCDGKAASCVYPAPQTPCASQCQAGIVTPATCDGAGSCVDFAPKACAGYACDGDVCGVSCRQPVDCVDGFACIDESCVPVSELACSPDLSTSLGPTGTSQCAPYFCDVERGVCKTSCETAAECAPGFVCDAPRHVCVVETISSESSGCSCRLSRGTSRRSAAWLGLAALLGQLWRRRRRS